jgi:hypothetical protein
VRKAIASRPRNAVVGDFNPLDDGADAAAASGDEDVAPAAAPAAAAPAAAAPAAPNVTPPEVWSDAVMNWRHPLSFVFILNGPLTSWHPHPVSREVCEFLKKAPRSGPQAGVLAVNREDGRRAQRADARGEARADVADQNDNLLATLRQSRCASAAALQTPYSSVSGRPKPKLPPTPTISCDVRLSRMKPAPSLKLSLLASPTN